LAKIGKKYDQNIDAWIADQEEPASNGDAKPEDREPETRNGNGNPIPETDEEVIEEEPTPQNRSVAKGWISRFEVWKRKSVEPQQKQVQELGPM
jgi:hypothetical protein